jgi:hypothetical protein
VCWPPSCREAEADKRDWQELLGQHGSSSSRHAASEDPSTSVPSTDAQLLRAKLIKTAQKLVNASKASRQHSQASSNAAATAAAEASTEAQQQAEQQQQQQQVNVETAGGQQEQQQERQTVGQQAMQQFEQLLSAADRDSYGTTQQSPAEIAQQIADSNRRAAGGGDGSDGEGMWLLEAQQQQQRCIAYAVMRH